MIKFGWWVDPYRDQDSVECLHIVRIKKLLLEYLDIIEGRSYRYNVYGARTRILKHCRTIDHIAFKSSKLGTWLTDPQPFGDLCEVLTALPPPDNMPLSEYVPKDYFLSIGMEACYD